MSHSGQRLLLLLRLSIDKQASLHSSREVMAVEVLNPKPSDQLCQGPKTRWVTAERA